MVFSDDEFDLEEEKFPGMFIGQVVKRDAELKRIKFKIPGFIEPESAWAFPLTSMAGGSGGVGAVGIPREDADVAIWFANGDIERPFYMPAHWGDQQVPEEVADKEDAIIWSGENFAILMDETEGERVLKMINRKTGDFIEMNAEDNSITISGTTAITITSVGIVDIQGAKVQINGRPVAPIGDPL